MENNIVMPQDEVEKAIRQAKKLKQGKVSMKELVLQNIQMLLMKTKTH